MKKGNLLAAVILLSAAGLAQAQEGKLGVILDVTYASRYIWRGFDLYKNNHSAIQPSIDLDLYGTGFGINVFWSRANGSGFENAERFEYTIDYGSTLFEGETYATDYSVGWIYYNYPDNPRKALDLQEAFASFSWPNICPLGFVPSYTIIKMWPAEGGADPGTRDYGGWLHVFGLGYDLALPGFMPGTTEQILHLSTDIVYNDGLGGDAVDHDWSHAVFGASTGFAVTDNLTFTPAVYYQSSWEDSVDSSDEVWTTMSMTYKF